ncbi:glycosyl transferase family 39 [Mycobacteroides abscessus subsp. abscessus]|uniref:glycosyl transferase family 39 n=1 Tax=Mycobacteroides abscessus TaxID=36809 RepID=UPI00266CC578|nr:glycosyl transferase family 39 [Mycobacteroides abscessus]MDO3014640.1 glycosyl transferase family 39 [Mycobacteroides abscessus subsp. abscessus]
MNITTLAANGPHTTILAVNDLVSGSHLLYTMIVGLLVIAALVGGGARAVAAFFGGRIGETVLWAVVAIVVAVFVGSGYAIYMSTKRSVDQTGLTTGQFGR